MKNVRARGAGKSEYNAAYQEFKLAYEQGIAYEWFQCQFWGNTDEYSLNSELIRRMLRASSERKASSIKALLVPNYKESREYANIK